MLPEPGRGGFHRPFGAAQFILDFLRGRGPSYGVDAIDPGQGAPQTDIHAAYNRAVLLVVARDRANRKEERAARRQKRNLDMDRIEELTKRYLEKPPRGYAPMRYHSFVSYFAKLKALGWVEATGETEPSLMQDTYNAAPPRIFYHLTATGRSAPAAAVRDLLAALYGRTQA